MNYDAISAWAAWAAVACALLLVVWQNREARRLTCLQLFVQIASQYDSADMQRIRASLAKKLLSDPTTVEINDSLLVFYENVAILHRRKLLDSELVVNTFSIDVCSYWTALKPYIDHMRNAFSDPTFFIELERLNEYFAKQTRYQVSPSSVVGVTPDAVREFLRMESLRGAD